LLLGIFGNDSAIDDSKHEHLDLALGMQQAGDWRSNAADTGIIWRDSGRRKPNNQPQPSLSTARNPESAAFLKALT
jgi:hypothetical protein